SSSASAPLAFAPEYAGVPERSETQAILVPSGENWGLRSCHVDATNCVTLPVGRSNRQMCAAYTRLMYAARRPFRAMTGQVAFSPLIDNGCACPPDTLILQSLGWDSRRAENTISRPSGIQLKPSRLGMLAKRVLASPPLTGTTRRSPSFDPNERWNATV